MLLYEYPGKNDMLRRRRNLAADLSKKKKLRRSCLITLIAAAVIFAIGLTAEGLAAKIGICSLSIVTIALNVGVTSLALSGFDVENKEKTSVTDVGFTHETLSLTGKRLKFDIRFCDVSRTRQNMWGDLVIDLKSGGQETVPFRVTETKLFLIKNLSEKLCYPKKNYLEIEDDESEGKDWVDRL